MDFSTSVLQLMKKEQAQLSLEASECASAIPELSQMIVGVQALGELYSFMRVDVICFGNCAKTNLT